MSALAIIPEIQKISLCFTRQHTCTKWAPAWKTMRNKRISDQQRSLKDGTHICNNGSVKNQDKKCKNPTSQSFTSRYILYEKQGPERNSYAYGLLRQERHADRWVTVAITAPFSNNKPSLMQFSSISFIFLMHSTISWMRKQELIKTILRPNILTAAPLHAYVLKLDY